jgi:antitoxin (DNA-binding transcriptional repressor) of toxin-antitoxin stability system
MRYENGLGICDVQHNFSRVLSWVTAGETVPVAKLVRQKALARKGGLKVASLV